MRKGARECTKRPLYLLAKSMSFQKFSLPHRSFLVNLNAISIPGTLSETLSNEEWKKAMGIEMEALEKNRTWEIVNLSRDKKIVGCKWIFTVRYKSDGSLERYQARLVANYHKSKRKCLLRHILRLMELVIRRHLHQLLR